jgi:5-methylcytosine-specific restriction endonuclease McrA
LSYLSRTEKLSLVRVLRERDGNFCCWCRRILRKAEESPPVSEMPLPDDYPTLEHLIKRCHGGKHRPYNLKLSCPSCNQHRERREGELLSQATAIDIPRRFN